MDPIPVPDYPMNQPKSIEQKEFTYEEFGEKMVGYINSLLFKFRKLKEENNSLHQRVQNIIQENTKTVTRLNRTILERNKEIEKLKNQKITEEKPGTFKFGDIARIIK